MSFFQTEVDFNFRCYKGGGTPEAPPAPPPTPSLVRDNLGDPTDIERERARKKRGRKSTILAGTLGGMGEQGNTTLG